ncbi:MAG: asparagine synthase (glutamine-hydrolyzing) [Bacteroidetes bacterium]|nr:MAG: asparagine synthase (glutamine-hydrolyzing) [Bacteroidota bacterium]
MCGIAGFYDSHISPESAESLIQGMLKSIGHRGPDARSTRYIRPLSLGHNRLSIIDLSEDGNQPMEYFGAVIVFNGEIYNYKELRDDLRLKGYEFRTESDTEVILASYREYGEACVEKFVGMWAFALWDIKEEFLFCSRDRFGIKPFYYIHENDRFYFGSEYRQLKLCPLFSKELNWAQVSRGLQLGWIGFKDETYYSNLKSLPAACNLVFANGKATVRHYWDISTAESSKGSFYEKAERFRELFIDSVRLHMRSDVEVGACLSGGLDSSSIVSVVSKEFTEKKFKTFTIYYDGKNEVDERPWVNEVLKGNPNLSPHFLMPKEQDVAEVFDHALFHSEVPMAGSSPISQYFVMKLAKENGMKVLLDGQGSDEYLAGYMHSFYRLIGGKFRNLNFIGGISEWTNHAKVQQMNFSKRVDVLLKSILTTALSEKQLYTFEYRNYFPFLGPDQKTPFEFKHLNGSPLKKFLYHLMFNTSLPNLLHYEDRNSMAFSIESRVPFLDHRLVEFAFSLCDDDLIHKGTTKRILRKGLEGIIPDTIAQRKDKKGFVTPGEIKWLRGPLSFLLESDFKRLDNLDKKEIKNLIQEFKKGDNRNANLVWRVVVLDYWLKQNA